MQDYILYHGSLYKLIQHDVKEVSMPDTHYHFNELDNLDCSDCKYYDKNYNEYPCISCCGNYDNKYVKEDKF